MEDALTTEPPFAALDVPIDTTAEQVADILNEQFGNRFYVTTALQWPGAGVRLVLRRYSKADKPAKPAAPSKESTALAFMRDNPDLTVKQLCAAFKALGFPRGEGWISERRRHKYARL